MSKNEVEFEFSALPLSLKNALDTIPQDTRYFIALSGGLDSVALLHFSLPILRQREAEVIPLHIHHGLSPNADLWAKHCTAICKELGLQCQVEKVNVRSSGEGLEAAAREARYRVFAHYLEEGGVLLQGHHLNDQAETVLMRMIRGAGPEGLAGIPQRRDLSAGRLYRPWLHIPRQELEDQAKRFGLSWVEDESNRDLAFDRNYVRHEVIPVLSKRWSTVLQSLGWVAQRSADAHALVTESCAGLMSQVLSKRFPGEHALDCEALSRLDQIQQHALVRFWLEELNVPHPSQSIFERIWTELIPAAADKEPLIQWGSHQIRRYQSCLFYVDAQTLDEPQETHELSADELSAPMVLAFGRRFLVVQKMLPGQAIPDGVTLLRWPTDDEKIRFSPRRGGESFELKAGQGRRPLKKWFQEAGVPPWRRSQIPLLFYGDTLAMAGFSRVAEGFAPEFAQPALGLSWRDSAESG